MKNEVGRVHSIFTLLGNGVPSSEIIEDQEARKRRWDELRARGQFSEENVARVLGGLPMVSTVNRVEANSPGDQNGIDIVVGLKGDLPEGLVGKARVQVKSSEQYISEFRERIKRENNLNTDREVNEWLIRNCWVLLNGQLPDGVIAASFEFQLAQINEYARTEETKADKDYIERRMKEQARRYLDRLRNGTLTPEWRAWGRKHPFEIAKLVY